MAVPALCSMARNCKANRAMALTIRAAQVSDLAALRELYRELNPGDPPWPSAAAATEQLRDVLRHAGTTILLAEVKGVCVSTCMLVICPNFSRGGRPFALIENVVTLRDHRRCGYGRRIVRHAIELARERGCYRVNLMTGSRREETLRFYEGVGLKREVKTAFEARFT
jgi:GNAT superfamily N-acetyltransferase